MKSLTFLSLILLFLALAASLCAADQEDYNYLTSYSGIYKKHRIYIFNDYQQLWLGSKRHNNIQQLQCSEAVNALRAQGTWTGNLSKRGECLGYAEAPTWATGNYLNYLSRAIREKGEKE